MPPHTLRTGVCKGGAEGVRWSFALASALTVSDLGQTNCLVDASWRPPNRCNVARGSAQSTDPALRDRPGLLRPVK